MVEMLLGMIYLGSSSAFTAFASVGDVHLEAVVVILIAQKKVTSRTRTIRKTVKPSDPVMV
jgi:hypothetical protein